VPSTVDDAFDFVDAVRAQPGHVQLAPGPRHLALLRQLCIQAEASGDQIPDAVIAAVAAEHGCIVATLDRDFARFTTISHLLV
jgi:predicted nucleic acid-binding protein